MLISIRNGRWRIFQGHYHHVNGIRSLIVLEENNKNFYTFLENIKNL